MISTDLTIITTSFNDSKNINRYVQMIEAQTIKPLELIFVDGGSKDNTCEVIKESAEKSDINIRLISDGRLNIAQAFNKGIKATQTPFLIITCLGNAFPTTMCGDLLRTIENEKSDAAYGLLKGIERGPFSKLYNSVCLKKEGVPIMSNRCVLYNINVFDKIGYFIENFKYAGEDAEYLTRFDNAGLKKSLVNNVTVFWETPNSWREYFKKQEGYAIAELQYASFSSCFITDAKLKWYFILLTVLLAPVCYPITLLGLTYLLIKIIKGTIYRKSIKEELFSNICVLVDIYYKAKNIKYFSRRYHVSYGIKKN